MASFEQRIFIAPKERNVAMVFQSYALYPHLNTFENIAFPLRIAKARQQRLSAEQRGVECIEGPL